MAELNIQYPDYPRSDLMARQANALDQAYALRQQEMGQEQEVRNALSGVKSMGDVQNVLPQLFGKDYKAAVAINNSLATQDNNKLLRQIQLQKLIGDPNDPKAQKAAWEIATKVIPTISSHPDPLGAYTAMYGNLEGRVPPGSLRHPSTLKGPEDTIEYVNSFTESLAPWGVRVNANTPHPYNMPGVDEEGSPVVTPTMIMPGQGLQPPKPIGVPSPKSRPPEQKPLYNPKQAMERMTALAKMEESLDKPDVFDQIAAATGNTGWVGKASSPETKEALKQQIAAEKKMIEPFIPKTAQPQNRRFAPPSGVVTIRNPQTNQTKTWNYSTGQYE